MNKSGSEKNTFHLAEIKTIREKQLCAICLKELIKNERTVQRMFLLPTFASVV